MSNWICSFLVDSKKFQHLKPQTSCALLVSNIFHVFVYTMTHFLEKHIKMILLLFHLFRLVQLAASNVVVTLDDPNGQLLLYYAMSIPTPKAIVAMITGNLPSSLILARILFRSTGSVADENMSTRCLLEDFMRSTYASSSIKSVRKS